MQQLATLAKLKKWIGQTSVVDDDALLRLINTASQFIFNYIQRPSIFRQTFTDLADGLGGNRMMLREWPVVSVSAVNAGTQVVPAAPLPPNAGAGYIVDQYTGFPPGSQQSLTLAGGYVFPRGRSNVTVTYEAGYCVKDEAATVPATPYQVTVAAPYGSWGRDDGVTLANGTPLAKVSGAPGAMQYSVTDGVYTFNAAQASAAVLISYSYIPADLEDACIELAGERYKYSFRIGQMSASAAGQVTTSYSLKAVPDFVRETLARYRRRAMC